MKWVYRKPDSVRKVLEVTTEPVNIGAKPLPWSVKSGIFYKTREKKQLFDRGVSFARFRKDYYRSNVQGELLPALSV